MPAPANPDQGEVAIPWSRQHDASTSGYVVGCLGARAIRWVEESTGRGIDQIWMGFQRSMEAGSMAGIRLSDATTIVWASIEHHRRRRGAPGPEFTIDDADEIADEIGRDDFYAVAWNLMYWSISGRKRREQIESEAEAAGKEAELGELRAVAAGTGTPTSPPGSAQESPSTTSGDSHPES
ncbi:MAG: hypothetical protein U5R31_03015 [Acidimicrobiia bacterium]|nr:hypothetical protein [Acidimicrobiia bacterium]